MPPFREISISRNQETLLNQMQKSSFPEVWKPTIPDFRKSVVNGAP